jgi:hypothetical protein
MQLGLNKKEIFYLCISKEDNKIPNIINIASKIRAEIIKIIQTTILL